MTAAWNIELFLFSEYEMHTYKSDYKLRSIESSINFCEMPP